MTTPDAAATLALSEPDGDGTRRSSPWLLGFVCLYLGLIPSYLVLPGPLKSNGSPPRMIAYIFFGLIVLGLLVHRRNRPAAPEINPGVFPVLVYALVSIFIDSHAKPTSEYAASRQIGGLLTTIAFTGLALHAMTRVKTPRQSRFVLGCLAIGLTFGCLVAFLQSAAHVDVHLLFQPPGFIDNTVDLGFPSKGERNGVLRSAGTASHPIEFSVIAAVTVILNTFFVRYPGNLLIRVLAWLGVAIALLALPAGVSRSGAVALAVAFVIYMWSFKLRTLLVAIAVGSAGILIEFVLAPRFITAPWDTIIGSSDDASILDRINDYAYVSRVFHDHPIFGLGSDVKKPDPADPSSVLDNQWLGELVQGGLVGLTAFIILVSGVVFGLPAALRTTKSPEERDRAFAVGSSLIGITVTSLTFDLFAFQAVSFVFFILYGLLWSGFKLSYHPNVSYESGSGDVGEGGSGASLTLSMSSR